MIGELIVPYFAKPKSDLVNRETLGRQLNEGNPFDFELIPQLLDQLTLYFDCKGYRRMLIYSYYYTNKGWAASMEEYLNWRQYEQVFSGRIQNAMKRQLRQQ